MLCKDKSISMARHDVTLQSSRALFDRMPAGLVGSAPPLLAGSTPLGFEPLSLASDPVLVPSAPSAPPALVPGPGGASAFSNDPTVDRSLFDRLRPGRSLEEVRDRGGPAVANVASETCAMLTAVCELAS